MPYPNRIAQIQWDEGNRLKCQKHGVALQEIEELFAGVPVVFSDPSVNEGRLRAIGRTAIGRYLFVAFRLREAGGATLIRPISARFMHQKEIRQYEEAAISRASNRRGS